MRNIVKLLIVAFPNLAFAKFSIFPGSPKEFLIFALVITALLSFSKSPLFSINLIGITFSILIWSFTPLVLVLILDLWAFWAEIKRSKK